MEQHQNYNNISGNKFEFNKYVPLKNNVNSILIIAAVIFAVLVIYFTFRNEKDGNRIINNKEEENVRPIKNQRTINENVNTILSKDRNNDSDQKNQQDSDEFGGITQFIKEINNSVHDAFDKETINKLIEDCCYTYALKNTNGDLEFYIQLAHDSEGWPMEASVYYFKKNKIIAYSYIICNGCLGQDISSKLKSLKIKPYDTNEVKKDLETIWIVSNPNEELLRESSEILKKFL